MRFFRKIFGLSKPRNLFTINDKPVSLGDDYNLEAHLGRVIEAYKIDVVIDVGANEGQFGTRLRKQGYTGALYSFEPVKAVFNRLQAHASGDGKWHVFNIALGEKRSQTQINVSDSSDFSSILAPNEFGAGHFKGIKVTAREDVEIHRLDEFMKDFIDVKKHRVLLKTDTQGYDFQVIEGAKGLLADTSAIVSEMSLIPIYHGMKTYLEMLNIHQENGFSVSGIYPMSRNKKDLSLIEIDCVLVNRKMY